MPPYTRATGGHIRGGNGGRGYGGGPGCPGAILIDYLFIDESMYHLKQKWLKTSYLRSSKKNDICK